MKILYVSQYFPPEMGAPAARVHELSRYWAREGHDVTVLTGFPNNPTGIVHEGYRSKIWRLIYKERVEGINVVRTWLAPLPNRKAWERVLNYTSFCLSASFTGSFLRRPDVVIGTSPQLLIALAGWWLGLVKRVPFIFEVRDLWPESLAASGVGADDSLMNRVLGAVVGFLYRRSDHIVVVTSAFERVLVDKWQVPPQKISLVENGVESDLFSPEGDSEKTKSELGVSGKFVVSYIGTHGLAHGLNTMLQAAAILKDELPDVVFMLVGEGTEKEALISRAESMGLDNVIFLPSQPREKIPDLIRASDACLVLLKKADTFKTVIPTKMLEFMSCGSPVVLGVEGHAKELLEKAQAGVAIEPEDADALASAITKLYKDPALRESLGRNGNAYTTAYASREKTAQRYTDIIRGLIRG